MERNGKDRNEVGPRKRDSSRKSRAPGKGTGYAQGAGEWESEVEHWAQDVLGTESEEQTQCLGLATKWPQDL